MRKTFLDTSYVVALVNQRDENHEKSRELMAAHERAYLITTDAVILEIGNSLARSYKSRAVEVIENIFDSSDIEIVRLNEALLGRAFDLYKNYDDKSWGLVDCLSFVVMRENNVVDALTSDGHFSQAGFNALMLEPFH